MLREHAFDCMMERRPVSLEIASADVLPGVALPTIISRVFLLGISRRVVRYGGRRAFVERPRTVLPDNGS